MLNYNEVRKKRGKLYQEISALMNKRFCKDDDIELNEIINKKKKEYEFYNQLLKRSNDFKGDKDEK